MRRNSVFAWRLRPVLILIGLFCAVAVCPTPAQIFTTPSGTNKFAGSMTSLDSIQTVHMDSNIFLVNTQTPGNSSPLETASGSVSKLDLKSPGNARREYEKGYQLLMRKDLRAAIEHLTKSTAIYPRFVAAHNALGTAYLDLGQNEQAQQEFAQAVALDDHLPNSYLNLGCAQLALSQYSDAEASFKKASSIAPLDLQLLTALAYGEFENRDYPAVIATVGAVHERKHEGAAVVHFFAAGAWEAQNNSAEAQRELEILLNEDPKSPSADQFRKILDQIKDEQIRRAAAKRRSLQPVNFLYSAPAMPTVEEVSRETELAVQNMRQQNQIAAAETEPDGTCSACRDRIAPTESVAPSVPASAAAPTGAEITGPVFRVAVDEVAVFFAATDHGKSVTNLGPSDVEIRDDGKPPEAILGFRNESELPLRLGLIIDTSNSIRDRFSFEQVAATKFLKTVLTGPKDLAFVVGVNNSVLLVQDFTADQSLTARAIGQLVPAGGTALWDAVAFAADKLSAHAETQPVARILVVISDGEENSSSATLKQAIEKAQSGEVAVYTVSTRDGSHEETSAVLGDQALKALAQLTGGSAFMPGSVRDLGGSLADLQQVIRGRYLVFYKASSFQLDGRYRSIDIKAEKEGHKLKVYARKGYYAAPAPSRSTSSNQ